MDVPPSRALGVLALTGILLCALALRAPCLSWGLQKDARTWTYHPDEPLVLWLADGVRAEGWGWVPEYHIGQPTGYGLLVMGLERAFFSVAPHRDWSVADLRGEALLLRGVTLALSLLSILLLHAIGRETFEKRAGGFAATAAAVLWALLPFAVYFSFFHTVNEVSLAPILLALLLWVRYDRAPSTRGAIFAACATALATGIKYTAAPLFLIGAGLPLLHRRPRDLGAFLPASAVLFALLPFVWLAPRATLRAYANFFAPGQGIYFSQIHRPPIPAFLATYAFAFPLGLGAFVAIGLALSARRWTTPGVRVLVVWTILYGLFLLAFGVRFARHFLPWFPVVLLLGLAGWGEIRSSKGPARWIPPILLAAFLPILFARASLPTVARFQNDTRDAAETEVAGRTAMPIGMAWYFWTPHLRRARSLGAEVRTEVYPWTIASDTVPRFSALLWGGPELDWIASDTFPAYRLEKRWGAGASEWAHGVEDLQYVSPEIRLYVPR